ncbi:hypothetical protein ATR1_056d0072 [Acetobacter tropicalis]|nr:hypothetical protein AD944_10060 [Acetobacter tropicalis]GAL96995.1 hypothetical protein ATR1_056d0072 [Acetobacter tropicalis]
MPTPLEFCERWGDKDQSGFIACVKAPDGKYSWRMNGKRYCVERKRQVPLRCGKIRLAQKKRKKLIM